MRMYIKIMIGCWLLSAGFINAAHATSFDCGKAVSDVEKMICADNVLSSLDSTLASVYGKAVFRSSDLASLKIEQKSWLKNTRNVCLTVQCVEVAYKQRLLDLNAMRFTYADLNTAINETCREMAIFESYASPGVCRLSASDSFGSMDDTDFHYALYCLGEPLPDLGRHQCTVSAMALFAQHKDTGVVERFHEHSADADSYFENPFISSSDSGFLLIMPVRISGTGSFNENDYFIRVGKQWVLMDTESWLVDLENYIPSGLEIMKGVEPNVDSMTASVNLYRPGDANCCPSGGSAVIELKMAGNRLSIMSVDIVTPKP